MNEDRYEVTAWPDPCFSVSICKICGSVVFDDVAHDKFHDDYKPARKATLIIQNEDGSARMQFIDGSVVNISNAAEMSMEQLIEFLNETNRALAPFYEGGETAIVAKPES